jgi:hypothetical protein
MNSRRLPPPVLRAFKESTGSAVFLLSERLLIAIHCHIFFVLFTTGFNEPCSVRIAATCLPFLDMRALWP